MNSDIQLLNEYKQYDSLNKNRERQLVKILVSFLIPIHHRRALEKENSNSPICNKKDKL